MALFGLSGRFRLQYPENAYCRAGKRILAYVGCCLKSAFARAGKTHSPEESIGVWENCICGRAGEPRSRARGHACHLEEEACPQPGQGCPELGEATGQSQPHSSPEACSKDTLQFPAAGFVLLHPELPHHERACRPASFPAVHENYAQEESSAGQ